MEPSTPLMMNSAAGNSRADRSEQDAVWESENPFAGQREDSTTSSSGGCRPLASPAMISNSWRRSTPEPPGNPSSSAYGALSNDHDTDGARPPRFTSRLNPTGQQAHSAFGPRQKRAHPSAAAASRTQVYNNPVDERDPMLELAEQSRGRQLAKEVYKPGMIFRAPLHEPFLPGATDINDRIRTHSLYGPVYTKVRRMIIVALYHDHYTALPIYTHNGNGLQGKLVPDEFVSIKDHRSQEPFTPLSKHSTLTTQTMNPGIHLMHPKATVHLTYPVSRKYDLPATPEGQLNKTSTEALIAKYIATISRPRKV